MKTEISNKLQEALRWRDNVERGEMIEDRRHRKSHMGFASVSSQELDAICDAANTFYKAMDSRLRISWSMGELRPGFSHQRELPFDKEPKYG